MALKYTGQTDVLSVNGKLYAKPKLVEKNPKAYDGSFDKPIPGMTRANALHLIENSSLHSFDEDGQDLLEKVTKE